MLSRYYEIHFYQLVQFKLIKTTLKSIHVLLSLSPIWNCYPKGSSKKMATERSMIAYEEINDRICNK